MITELLQNYYSYVNQVIAEGSHKMDLNDFSQIEKAAGFGRSELFRLGMALLFMIGIMLY